MTDSRFKPYDPEKPLLLAPDMRTWLPEDHLALCISDVVDALDLSEIADKYYRFHGGQPAYHPAMMLKLLFYGYCIGVRTSRRIEQKTYEDVGFRVLSCDTHPDHSRISDFRKRLLREISRLFVQVLEICKESGLVKLGHVALDGTKLKANASRHKAMSYGRMKKREPELAAEVDRLLAEAEALDQQEDKKYGKGKRGDELPKDLRFKQARLAKIRQAKQALEEQARKEAIEAGKLDDDGDPPQPAPRGRIPNGTSLVDKMLRKLKTKAGKQTYLKRKQSVEPVFGQIKEARGIRAFLLRGLEKVRAEWLIICLTHNILKLWRLFCPDGGRSVRGFA